MYGPMAGGGYNIKKRLQKWMDWQVFITSFHNTKKFVNTIKLNQETVEVWMLYQAVEELLDLYISMSKGTVTKVMKNQIEEIYSTHGEDNQEVCHFSNVSKTHACKCLRACVYIFCPSCDVFCSSRGKKRF